MTSRRVPAIAVLLAAGIAVLLAFVLPPHLVTIVSLVFVAGILASSVDMLAGQAGLMSLGHAGIAAAAAYGAAWAIGHDVALPGQLALALVVTLTVSAVYAAMTMRSRGIVFLMITLALGMVIFGLTLKLSTITGGQNGLTGLRRPPLLADPRAFYLAAALAFGLVAGFRWAFAASPFGMVLRGVRESETRMASLGYSVATAKLVAMMLSGLVAGVAGVLFVWQAEFLSPSLASFGRSANAAVMVILGGVGTLLGPLAGAAVVVGTEHWLSSYIERWPTLLGVFLIVAVLFAPRGIVGTFALRRRGHADGQPAAAFPGNSATTMSSPGQSNARSTTDDDVSASPHGGGS